MIMDSGSEIYVWIGEDATTEERTESVKLAKVMKMSQGIFKPTLLFIILNCLTLVSN